MDRRPFEGLKEREMGSQSHLWMEYKGLLRREDTLKALHGELGVMWRKGSKCLEKALKGLLWREKSLQIFYIAFVERRTFNSFLRREYHPRASSFF